MHSKKEFMTYDNAHDIVEWTFIKNLWLTIMHVIFLDELFESLLPRYQSDLETLTKRNDFVFDSVKRT